MLANRRIAVVDDDEGSRSSMVALLRSFGCSALAFDSAEACLADATTWDCIISDVNMPGTNGYEFLSVLQRCREPPPVILMTAYSTPNARLQTYEAGAACFFEKPVDDVLLLDCLNKVLGEVA